MRFHFEILDQRIITSGKKYVVVKSILKRTEISYKTEFKGTLNSIIEVIQKVIRDIQYI